MNTHPTDAEREEAHRLALLVFTGTSALVEAEILRALVSHRAAVARRCAIAHVIDVYDETPENATSLVDKVIAGKLARARTAGWGLTWWSSPIRRASTAIARSVRVAVLQTGGEVAEDDIVIRR